MPASLLLLLPCCHARQIGLVSQEPLLFSGSIGDNIRYGRPGAMQAEVEAAAIAANASDFIAALPGGYDSKVGCGWHVLCCAVCLVCGFRAICWSCLTSGC